MNRITRGELNEIADLLDRASDMAQNYEHDVLAGKLYAASEKMLSEELVPNERQWINVEDRLPLEFCASTTYETKTVLVSDGLTVCECDFARGNVGTVWRSFSHCMIPLEDVTHWMPLPAPPHKQGADT